MGEVANLTYTPNRREKCADCASVDTIGFLEWTTKYGGHETNVH
jgi:hypothetical protein